MTIERSESIKELAGALAKAQGEMRPAAKDAVNPHFKSRYADLGAVWEACRVPLTSNGLSVIQAPADSEPGRLALTTFLLHSSGEWLSTTYSLKLSQDTAHGAGSALTYLRRYALAALVGVVADEDDDGNTASQPQRQAPAQRPRPPANVNTRTGEIIGHENGASYQAEQEATAPAKPSRREKLLNRVDVLVGKMNAAKLPITLLTPIDEMEEAELTAFGMSLNKALADHAAKDLTPQRGMQEESLPESLADVRQPKEAR